MQTWGVTMFNLENLLPLLLILLCLGSGVGLAQMGSARIYEIAGRKRAKPRGATSPVLLGRANKKLKRDPGHPGRPGGLGAKALDFSLICTEVSTRLLAGAPSETAWEQAGARAGIPTGTDFPADFAPKVQDPLPPVLQCLEKYSEAETAGGFSALRAREKIRRSLGPEASKLLAPLQKKPAREALEHSIWAWKLSYYSGCQMARILDQVANTIIDAQSAADARASALAGPRSGVRVLQTLPFIALALGMLVGSNALEVFGDGAWGSFALLTGLAFALAGNIWSRALLRSASGKAESTQRTLMALACTVLESGTSLPAALTALGQACGISGLKKTAKLLVLGVSWPQAWKDLPDFPDLAHCLEPAWTSGVNPQILLSRAAQLERASQVRRSQIQAQKLGVRLSLPLGLCQLPAFVLLGVVPVILSTLGNYFP